ncbi:MAG: glycosyltransferase family 87 protein [Dehalococcoidales bacterium]|nr:glycosyltransferase family 87 protein [Dehalococcoidales bacterium]
MTEPRRNLLLFSTVHVFLFCSFVVPAQTVYFDPGALERYLAMKIMEGQVPYRDFPCEYPPLALLVFFLPALVTKTQVAYNIVFYLEMLICDLLIIKVLSGLAAKLGLSAGRVLVIYTVLLAAVGPLVIIRFDLLPALLVLVSLEAFFAGRNKTAWAVLAFGVTAKLYPLLMAPILAISHFARRQYRALLSGVIVFLGCLALVVVLALLLHASIGDLLGYHIGRGLHSESIYGTFLLLGQVLGLVSVTGGLSSGSWNLISPLADRLAELSFYISSGLLLLVFGCYAGILREKRGAAGQSADLRLVRFVFLAILLFIITSKVLSVQYLIWLCPLLPLIVRKGEDILWVLLVLAAGLTQWLFPYGYFEFERFKPYAVTMMLGRNLLLVALAVLTTLSICRKQSPG